MLLLTVLCSCGYIFLHSLDNRCLDTPLYCYWLGVGTWETKFFEKGVRRVEICRGGKRCKGVKFECTHSGVSVHVERTYVVCYIE